MTHTYDYSAEIAADLKILSINLKRDLAAIIPLNPTCADVVRLAIINDISSKEAFDIDGMAVLLDKSRSFIKRRVRHLERRGWLRYNKFSGAIKMGDLFFLKDFEFIADLNFLIDQTRNSLEEIQLQARTNDFVVA
jgi:hypothetical protein